MSLKPHTSAALNRIQPSATLAMTARVSALKASGVDVIGLSAGEPDFPTPAHIVEAACEAMRRGETRYTAVDGTAALKKAVAGKFRRENGLDYRPAEISVAGGAIAAGAASDPVAGSRCPDRYQPDSGRSLGLRSSAADRPWSPHHCLLAGPTTTSTRSSRWSVRGRRGGRGF